MACPGRRWSAHGERLCLMASLLVISLVTVLCQVYVLYYSHWTVTMQVSTGDSVAPLLSRVRGVFMGPPDHYFNNRALSNGSRHPLNPSRIKTPLGIVIDRLVQTAQRAGEGLRDKPAGKASPEPPSLHSITNSSRSVRQNGQTEKDVQNSPRVIPANTVQTKKGESARETLRVGESEQTNGKNYQVKNVRGSLLILPVKTNSVPNEADTSQPQTIGGPFPPVQKTAKTDASTGSKTLNVNSSSEVQPANSDIKSDRTRLNTCAPTSAKGGSIVPDVVNDGFRFNLTIDGHGGLLCPEIPPKLLGNLKPNPTPELHTLTLAHVEANHSDLNPGGEWSPKDCVARYRLAIVIPYRDRLAHLTVLLAHLLPILKRQQLHFRIFVVEQYGSLTFNKGRIMNAAFKEALKMYDFHCVIFHDVDLIPEDDRNMYTCPAMPRHMSVAVDSLNYRLIYPMLVGGVLNLRVEHFQQVNGYSNMYWGWGAEDDDMAHRILNSSLCLFRPPNQVARYRMITHEKRVPTPLKYRLGLLNTAELRYREDGLNNLNYTVLFSHREPLYTHLMVDIGEPGKT